MKDYEKLEVWQWAHEFTLEVYAITKSFPKEELFGLTSQLRRSSASIAANIAEGCGRDSDADFKRFLDIAYGSASESSYHLRLARDLGYCGAADFEKLNAKLASVRKMLGALIRILKSDRQPTVAESRSPKADRRSPSADG